MRNLPLGFAMILAAAVLFQRGWDMFGSGFSGDSAAASTSSAPVGGAGGPGAKNAPAHQSARANQRLARGIISRKYPKWSRDPRQWVDLVKLWTQESGWNDKAQNGSSGAAGIPQDITGNFHGGAAGQILWGLNYIADRYGSPSAAWAHEEANGWY